MIVNKQFAQVLVMWRQVSHFAMKLHLQQQKEPFSILGIDMGSQCSAISVSSFPISKAHLLKTIRQQPQSQKFMKSFLRAFKNENAFSPIQGVVIGKPFGYDSKICETIEKWPMTTQLQSLKCPYTFVDEASTTQEAIAHLRSIEGIFRAHGHLHNDKELLDGIAAINILERFIKYYNGQMQ